MLVGEWEVGPGMPLQVREVLELELQAKEGDLVQLWADGTVTLGRQATRFGAARVRAHLQPAVDELAAWPRRRQQRAVGQPGSFRVIRGGPAGPG